MFTSTFSTMALAGLLATGAVGGSPDWAASYSTALTLADEHKKPVAIFLSRGELKELTKGELSSDVKKSLKTNFIAMKIDTTTDEGKGIAAAFGIAEGLIISDKSGKLMSLRHEGPLTTNQVEKYLGTHDGKTAVTTTASFSTVVPASPVNVAATVPVQPSISYQQPVITYQQPVYAYEQSNRPILNAVQNSVQFVGGAVQQTAQSVGSRVQTFGQTVFAPLSGSS